MAWKTKTATGEDVIWFTEAEFNEVKNENIRLKERINELKCLLEINKNT